MLLSAFPSKKGMPESSLSHVWFSFLTSKLERLCFAVGHIKYGYVTVAVLVRKNYFETSSVFLAMGQLVWGHFRPSLWFIGPCCCCFAWHSVWADVWGASLTLLLGGLQIGNGEKTIYLFVIVRETLNRESTVPEKSSGGWTTKGKTVRGEEIRNWECCLGRGFGLGQKNVWTWHIFNEKINLFMMTRWLGKKNPWISAEWSVSQK